MLVAIFRGLFISLILFEFLNLVGFLNFPLDFSWFGLVITGGAAWLIVELLAYFLKDSSFLKTGLVLSFLGISIDAAGDIFRFYSRFNWYDKTAHLIAGGIIAFLLFRISQKFFEGRLIHSLFVVSAANLLGVLYEIEEYLEDLFIRQGRWLRLGDGPDIANDLLLNLLGSVGMILILNSRKIGFRKPSNLLILLSAFCFLLSTSFAAAPEELRKSIEQKSQELQEINKRIQEQQQKLEETQEQSKTLQKEIGRVNAQVQQLNLGIRSSEIVIEKLGLEIDSLQYNISDAEKQITAKREAIAEILRELQEKENESPLIVFLKNKTLAESVFEVQSLADLNNNLSFEISELNASKIELNKAIDETAVKKQQKENENAYLKNKKVITEDIKKEKQTILTETKNKESNYQKILSDLEKKQSAISDEIEELEDALRRSFDPTLLPLKRPGVLAWPALNPRITQNFGEISRLYRGKPHNGMDIGMPIGTPIFAADDGEVIAVGNNGRYQYGKYVLIKHNNNLATLYAHLSVNSVVKKGGIAKRGQLIGYSGNTGYAIGRGHLHFGLYWEPSIQLQSFPKCNCGLVPIGVTIDPRPYLPGSLTAAQ